MSDLIKVEKMEITPAVIKFDFEAAKKTVEAHLEKYQGIVLTAETVKDGKLVIREINETRKKLNSLRIDTKKEVSKPIEAFEASMKELIKIHNDAMDSLREQIAKFEAETLAGIEIKLNAYLIEAFEKQGVRNEYRKATVEGLVLLGSETATGNLAAKAKTELDTRVWDNLCDQQRDDLRLANLSADCFKAGLAAPLARQHVQHILHLEDAEYETKLAEILAAEIDREKQAVEFRARQAERAAQAAAQAVGQMTQPAVNEQSAQPTTTEQPTQPVVETVQDAGDWQILIKFTTPRANFTAEQVRIALNNKLEKCGFTTHEILEIK